MSIYLAEVNGLNFIINNDANTSKNISRKASKLGLYLVGITGNSINEVNYINYKLQRDDTWYINV